MLHHIHLHQQVTRFAYDELARFEPKFQLTTIVAAKAGETRSKGASQLLNIGSYIFLFVRYLKTAAKINKLQIGEIHGGVEHQVGTLNENSRARISLPVCMCSPFTLIFSFSIIRNTCRIW